MNDDDIIQLSEDESPPETEDWVLVTKRPSGKYEITSTVQFGPHAAKFGYTDGIPLPLPKVVALARDYAARIGNAKIYRHWNTHDT